MKTLYYDCFCGISGDMNAAALIDLGVPEQYLRDELAKSGIAGEFSLKIEKGLKNGIAGTKFDVILHDHDEHTHAHHGEGAHGHHRSLSDIRQLITQSGISEKAKALSIKIFTGIAQAEAKVHAADIEQVHFHEVGAVDSIVDIMAAAICLDYLQPDRIIASPIQLGGGFANCAHGMIPVPAPAVVEILKGIPVKNGLVDFESCTPTGAAILATIADEFVTENDFVMSASGYGLGHKTANIPNVLRVMLIEENTKADREGQWLLETNIDDMSPEMLAYVEEKLLQAGALDVFRTPIVMKKGRLAVKFSVLANKRCEEAVLDVIFTESTSIGIRKITVDKIMLPREFSVVDTPYGKVRVKRSFYKGELVRQKPEFEDCKAIAQEKSLSLPQVYKEVTRILEEKNDR